MRDAIVRSARAGETTQRTAERLLEIDDPIVRLPEHVRDLRDAARGAAETGDEDLLENAIERWRGRVERLGEGRPGGGPTLGATTVRSATQQLVADLRRARPGQIDRVVDRWVLERARHQERVIARTETVEAFRDVYRQSVEQQPHVVGLRWTLSGRHPRADVCDLLAHQDLHGLGPGGYPASEYPATPHPTDLCMPVAIVDSAYQRRELARVRGEPEPPRPWESGTRETAAQWLARQPEARRTAILGPTRTRVFTDAPERVVTSRGLIRPVHEVVGSLPRVRRLGPPVAARPLVVRDRAAMVRTFPNLPRRLRGSGS